MPTYEFRCAAGHDFEKFFQKISDSPATLPCPSCGLVAERRISGGAGLVFKGSGFYITDYGKDGKKDQREAAEKKFGGAKKDSAASISPPSSSDSSRDSSSKESAPAPKESTGGSESRSGDSGGAGSKGGTGSE